MAKKTRRPVPVIGEIIRVVERGGGVKLPPGALVGLREHFEELGVAEQLPERGRLTAVAIRKAIVPIDFARYPLDGLLP